MGEKQEPAIPRHAAPIVALAFASLLAAGPAQAATTVVLPDPSGITLFALGVAGLLLGRKISGGRKD